MLLAVAGVTRVTGVQEEMCNVLKLTHIGKMSLAVTGAPFWRAVTVEYTSTGEGLPCAQAHSLWQDVTCSYRSSSSESSYTSYRSTKSKRCAL